MAKLIKGIMFLQYLTLKKLVWSCWDTESASGAFDEELQKLNHFHPTLQKFHNFCHSPSQLSVQQRCLQDLGNVLGSKSLSPLAGSWLECWEWPGGGLGDSTSGFSPCCCCFLASCSFPADCWVLGGARAEVPLSLKGLAGGCCVCFLLQEKPAVCWEN